VDDLPKRQYFIAECRYSRNRSQRGPTLWIETNTFHKAIRYLATNIYDVYT